MSLDECLRAKSLLCKAIELGRVSLCEHLNASQSASCPTDLPHTEVKSPSVGQLIKTSNASLASTAATFVGDQTPLPQALNRRDADSFA